jgi:hypothetical protein
MAKGGRWEAKLFAQGQTFRNLTAQVTPSPTVRLGEVRDRIQVIRQIFRAPSSFRRTLYQRPAKALGKFWWRCETAGQEKGTQRLAIRLAVW